MTYPIFTNISDYVLDQLYGYQDANENIHNAIRLRDAFDVEHTWSNTDDTGLGTHNAGTMASTYLKTSTSTGSVDRSQTVVVLTTEYAFIPTMKATNYFNQAFYLVSGHVEALDSYQENYQELGSRSSTDYASYSIYNSFISYGTKYSIVYHIWRYVTASPPHALGSIENWGQFIYLHRNKSDGKILKVCTFDDAIWASGKINLPKNHPMRVKMCPSPWPSLKLESNEEVVLVDCRHLNVKEQFLEEKLKYDTLVSQRQTFIDSGISEAMAIQFEQEQLLKARKEQIQIVRAQADFHDIKAEREKAHKKLSKSDLSEDDKFLADIKVDEIFDRLEEKVNSRLKIMSKIDIIKKTAELKGGSLAEEINAGALEEINAEYEIDDKDKLPQVSEFKDSVKVLVASKRTDISKYKLEAITYKPKVEVPKEETPIEVPTEEVKPVIEPPKEEGKI